MTEMKIKIFSLKKILIGLAVFVFFILVFANRDLVGVKATIVPVTVTPCKIEFGNVFPEEQLTKTFSVSLATDCQDKNNSQTINYRIVQKIKPKHGATPPPGFHGTVSDYCQTPEGKDDQTRCYLNLCPFLTKVGDSNSDTEANASLGGSDKTDKWTINFLVPDIFGSVGQENKGGVVSEEGDYGCDIAIEIKEQPKTYKISGRKFEDKDGDRKFDFNEPGLSGWTIYLDANNNGQLDAGETSVVTDKDGKYSFSNLSAGTYHVREVLKSGWKQTLPSSGRYDVTFSASSQNATGKDFGNAKLGTISGMKFEDKNGNGRKNDGENGLVGWTIQLKQGNSVVAQVTTGNDGKYSFANLGPGSYTVREVQQTGWRQTTSNPATVIITSGTNDTDNNFGNQKKR